MKGRVNSYRAYTQEARQHNNYKSNISVWSKLYNFD